MENAIQTSDAGYLTRRLIEVVQHIVICRTDCGTIRGVSVSPRNDVMPEELFPNINWSWISDDAYIGKQWIASQNQDIGFYFNYLGRGVFAISSITSFCKFTESQRQKACKSSFTYVKYKEFSTT